MARVSNRAILIRESLDSDLDFCICGAMNGFTNLNQGKYWVCVDCMKPTRAFMNECDTCNKLFKGGLPKAKFAFTCPTCESRL